MKTRFRILAAAAALAAPCAFAAPDPWDAGFTIAIGGYNPEAQTTVRVDGTGGRFGTQVSFEGDLGGENRKAIPTLDMLWRFGQRNALEASVVSLRREGNTTLRGSVDWGDRTFEVNAPVTSTFDSDIVRLAWRWSFVHDDTLEFGTLLGVHYTRLETSLSSTTTSISVSEAASADYPLPTIGLHGSVRMGDNFRLAGFGQFLKLKIDEYDGEMLNFGIGLEWAFARGMFAGLGYDYYEYKLTSTKDRGRGQFDYVFDGPKLYFGFTF